MHSLHTIPAGSSSINIPTTGDRYPLVRVLRGLVDSTWAQQVEADIYFHPDHIHVELAYPVPPPASVGVVVTEL